MLTTLGLSTGASRRRLLEVLALAASFALIAAIVLGGAFPV